MRSRPEFRSASGNLTTGTKRSHWLLLLLEVALRDWVVDSSEPQHSISKNTLDFGCVGIFPYFDSDRFALLIDKRLCRLLWMSRIGQILYAYTKMGVQTLVRAEDTLGYSRLIMPAKYAGFRLCRRSNMLSVMKATSQPFSERKRSWSSPGVIP